ncbi:hypothetical protein NDN08_003744 [Rhodosorus marinus]|uniref:Uncharacterized protein n=1 Tax=Rhodosorus marinus TaxID=101924 RepID=A0AAV8UGB8_9RHOD|nr:hypothetical protein NDN08_003744 [Rhodosorus marinus]
MARVAILFLFSLALLALLGTASPLTCSEEPAFLRFTAGSSRFDLIDDSNKRFGVLNMTVSEGEVANFFKMEFSVFPHIGLLKIRAGLFASGGSFVMGKQRYTRRRKLSKLDDESTWISEASIIMKPEDIMVITPGVSCCGAQLDFYAFAQVRVLGEEGPEEVRVYLAPSSTGTSCRVPNPKKPFRQVCSIETLCLTCSSSNCEPNQVCPQPLSCLRSCGPHTYAQHADLFQSLKPPCANVPFRKVMQATGKAVVAGTFNAPDFSASTHMSAKSFQYFKKHNVPITWYEGKIITKQSPPKG